MPVTLPALVDASTASSSLIFSSDQQARLRDLATQIHDAQRAVTAAQPAQSIDPETTDPARQLAQAAYLAAQFALQALQAERAALIAQSRGQHAEEAAAQAACQQAQRNGQLANDMAAAARTHLQAAAVAAAQPGGHVQTVMTVQQKQRQEAAVPALVLARAQADEADARVARDMAQRQLDDARQVLDSAEASDRAARAPVRNLPDEASQATLDARTQWSDAQATARNATLVLNHTHDAVHADALAVLSDAANRGDWQTYHDAVVAGRASGAIPDGEAQNLQQAGDDALVKAQADIAPEQRVADAQYADQQARQQQILQCQPRTQALPTTAALAQARQDAVPTWTAAFLAADNAKTLTGKLAGDAQRQAAHSQATADRAQAELTRQTAQRTLHGAEQDLRMAQATGADAKTLAGLRAKVDSARQGTQDATRARLQAQTDEAGAHAQDLLAALSPARQDDAAARFELFRTHGEELARPYLQQFFLQFGDQAITVSSADQLTNLAGLAFGILPVTDLDAPTTQALVEAARQGRWFAEAPADVRAQLQRIVDRAYGDADRTRPLQVNFLPFVTAIKPGSELTPADSVIQDGALMQFTRADGTTGWVDAGANRTYDSLDDFRHACDLPVGGEAALMVAPDCAPQGADRFDADGQLRLFMGEARIESVFEAANRTFHLDAVLAGGLLAAGVLTDGIVPLLAGAAGLVYGAARSDLPQMISHDEDLNPLTSGHARQVWGTVLAEGLGGAATVALGRALVLGARTAAEGAELEASAASALNTSLARTTTVARALGRAAGVAGGVNLADGVAEALPHLDEMSEHDRDDLWAQLVPDVATMLLTHAVDYVAPAERTTPAAWLHPEFGTTRVPRSGTGATEMGVAMTAAEWRAGGMLRTKRQRAEAQSVGVNKMLVVLAHPDDDTIMAGMLRRAIAAGTEIHVVYITRGNGGTIFSTESGIPLPVYGGDGAEFAEPGALGHLREEELRAFYARLGGGARVKVTVLHGNADINPWRRPGERVLRYSIVARWNMRFIVRYLAERMRTEQYDLAVGLRINRNVHPAHAESSRLMRQAARAYQRSTGQAMPLMWANEIGWYPTSVLNLRGRTWTLQLNDAERRLKADAIAAYASQPPAHAYHFGNERPYEQFTFAAGTPAQARIDIQRYFLRRAADRDAAPGTSPAFETVTTPPLRYRKDWGFARVETVEPPLPLLKPALPDPSVDADAAVERATAFALRGEGVDPEHISDEQEAWRMFLSNLQPRPLEWQPLWRRLLNGFSNEPGRFWASRQPETAVFVTTSRPPQTVFGEQGIGLALDASDTQVWSSITAARGDAARQIAQAPGGRGVRFTYPVVMGARDLGHMLKVGWLPPEAPQGAIVTVDANSRRHHESIPNPRNAYGPKPGEPYTPPTVSGGMKIRGPVFRALTSTATIASATYAGVRYGLPTFTLADWNALGLGMLGLRSTLGMVSDGVRVRIARQADASPASTWRLMTGWRGTLRGVSKADRDRYRTLGMLLKVNPRDSDALRQVDAAPGQVLSARSELGWLLETIRMWSYGPNDVSNLLHLMHPGFFDPSFASLQAAGDTLANLATLIFSAVHPMASISARLGRTLSLRADRLQQDPTVRPAGARLPSMFGGTEHLPRPLQWLVALGPRPLIVYPFLPEVGTPTGKPVPVTLLQEWSNKLATLGVLPFAGADAAHLLLAAGSNHWSSALVELGKVSADWWFFRAFQQMHVDAYRARRDLGRVVRHNSLLPWWRMPVGGAVKGPNVPAADDFLLDKGGLSTFQPALVLGVGIGARALLGLLVPWTDGNG